MLVPMLRQQKQTTVRIRTKNNSYVYSQDKFDSSAQKLPKMMSQTLQNSPSRDQSPSQMWEVRRKKQEQIQKYKEFKLQKQIEFIEH